MSVKIAIVGAGYMATEHARAFAAMPGVEIVGVVGRSPERASALGSRYGARVLDDVEGLWRETRADAVVVAVNEPSMAAICDQVFRFPWTVLLEKPVGVDLADAHRIHDRARSHGAQTRVWVGLNRRAYASTRQALGMIPEEGSRLVSVLDQQDMNVIRAMGKPEIVVRNYMYANSLHLIDYFNVFCRGELASVEVAAPWTPETPGHVVATLLWSSGDRGVYQALWDGPGPWAVSVAHPQMRLEMRPLESLTVQRRGERQAVPAAADPVDMSFKPGLYIQAQELLRAMDGKKTGLASLEGAIGSMSLCAKIYGLT